MSCITQQATSITPRPTAALADWCRRIASTSVALLSLSTMVGCVAYSQEAVAPQQTEAADNEQEPLTPSLDTPVLSQGEEIAVRAIALVGTPYRYGGADLKGFDCSGLVYFVHHALGIEVPRTAADQQLRARKLNRQDLTPGDLLFFRTTSSKRITHVGIYVGDNRFVHAPQSGKMIELRSLDDAYYGKRFVSAGRLHMSSSG